MAVDKLVDSTQLDSDLTSVANAIRTKGGTSAQLAFPAGFVSAVQAIPSGGITPSGTKQISITQNGTTTEDVTNYANAEITVNVSGGTNYGTTNNNSLAEMFYAIEHNMFSTGRVTVSSYFPANTESEFCDTGYDGDLRGMVVFNEDAVDSSTSSFEVFEAIGFFGKAASQGANQGVSSVSCVTKLRSSGSVYTTFLGTYGTSRVNSGKLYINPNYASTTNTLFHQGHSYRWIAWSYDIIPE